MTKYKRPDIAFPTTECITISYFNKFKKVITDNLKEIIKSIAEQIPDSNFAKENIIDDLRYLNFEDALNMLFCYFTFKVIGLCYCEDVVNVIDIIVKYLTTIEYCTDHIENDDIIDVRKSLMYDNFNIANTTDDPLVQFMADILDNKNLSDHGYSINNAWITDLGRVCLYVYKIYLLFRDNEDDKD